jgi:Uma2 family endonuclease
MHVPLHHGADTHVADIAAAGESALFGPQAITEPELIIGVFDSRTHRTVRYDQMPAYREMPSVREILLVAAVGRHVELHRREGLHWYLDIFPSDGDRIPLTSIGIEIPLAELYDGIVFDERLTG